MESLSHPHLTQATSNEKENSLENRSQQLALPYRSIGLTLFPDTMTNQNSEHQPCHISNPTSGRRSNYTVNKSGCYRLGRLNLYVEFSVLVKVNAKWFLLIKTGLDEVRP